MTIADYTFSTEAAAVSRSVMRELLAHAVDPNIISLATGLPASEFLPVERFSQCLSDVLLHDGGGAMQYGPAYMPLREWIAGYMRSRGVACQPENILITNGSQQGLTILSRMFLDHGDAAVIESATFTGIIKVTAGYGAQVRAIPTDLTTGPDMAALEAAFALEPRPRLAILIPDFHNPLGVSISEAKRRRAAELAAQYAVPLVEDDPYSLLRFSGEMLPPIKVFDPGEHVFYLGSFSKMLAPGLRLGWIVAPAELLPRMTAMREAIDLESSALMQRAVAEFLRRDWLAPHLEALNNGNRQRCEALLAALDAHLGDVATWTEPQGGLFVWLTLPETVDTAVMVKEAISSGVLYIPGAAFSPTGEHHNCMRLNFSSVKPEDIQEGVRRLAQVIRRWL